MVEQVYRPRRPKSSPLWKCLSGHFNAFLELYEEQYQPRYGFLRPIIPEVVNKFLDCGDLEHGFARVRCDDCKHEYLLAFSCKGRWFCPCCHQKKVQIFGALLSEAVLFPVPHRHFTFGMPKMLRPYFRFDRDLLKDLCRIAHECLLEYLRTTLGLPEGLPGIVMAIHTFGEYLDFHPHLHALVADGLFARSGLFYVLPDVSLKPLEALFRARVITFLVDKGLLPPARANMLRGWVHSGFNMHRSRRVLPNEREELERIAQYIIRNPFAVDKMQVAEPSPPTQTARSSTAPGSTRRYSATSRFSRPATSSPPLPSTSRTRVSSLSATTAGTATRCADSATSMPPKRQRRPARPSRSSTFPNTSLAASRPRNGANSSRRSGKPIRSSVRNARKKCVSFL
ncbi:MAG TPA: hypothetical protein DEW46_00675 [Verrucomicrobia bacterium]|nr:hypothetical protein [Verrucomicrobiota bacterium]